MSSELYRILHVVGAFMVFSGLAGLWGVYSSGQPPRREHRVVMALVHGLGLALLVVTGFLRLRQLGYGHSLPGWVLAKVGIWLVLGGTLALAKRRVSWALWLWLALGAAAAYLGILKPF